MISTLTCRDGKFVAIDDVKAIYAELESLRAQRDEACRVGEEFRRLHAESSERVSALEEQKKVLFDQNGKLMERIDSLEDAIRDTIARADDHADSYITRPIRDLPKQARYDSI